MENHMLHYDDEKNLQLLLQTFGSVVTLEDIASAYCQSGRNPHVAGDILCSLQSGTPKSTLSAEEDLESTIVPSVCSLDAFPELTQATKSKPIKSSASFGTVSGMIGKGYGKPKVSTSGSIKQKPMKLNSDEFPASELWDEKDFPNPTPRGDTMQRDMEGFLFEMLGKGFSLDKSVIHDIVGQCGYDMTKSMDKLLDLSASKLEKSDDIQAVPDQKPLKVNHNKMMERIQNEAPHQCSSSGSFNRNLTTQSTWQLVDTSKKNDLQKEILNALFTISERSESPVCYPTRNVRRSSAFGQLVEKPLRETVIDYRPIIQRKQVIANDEEVETSYDGLRKAVMEYWTTMKEYYKAAADAFAKQDHEKAQILMEEGHFYMKKAREADEKSAEKLYASNDEEEMVINLLDFEPKESVRFLKVQLTTLSGILAFKYLKVRVMSDEQNAKDGSRKRQITRFLGKEDIQWTEEENGRVFVISLDQIDPKKLSFANKQ